MSQNFKLADTITIEGRKIGPGHPVFIIAEVGINHNGDVELGKKMIDAAAATGADCVKFQTFRAEEFMADRNLEYEYLSGGKKVREKMFEMFKKVELSLAGYKELFDYARKKGVVPLTSVADPQSADFIQKIGVGGFKLASEDLINLPLVEYMAKKKMSLILSTGMADETEVKDVLKILKKYKMQKVCFLHCVSVYPTEDQDANLLRMMGLKKLTKASVGYSDHTLGIEAVVAAVAMGACMIEKHFTLDTNLPGPDQALSSDPAEFTALVNAVRRVEKMRGSELVEPSTPEKETRKIFRRSIVATEALPKGHKIRREDLHVKRPGDGLRAREIPKVLGKTLRREIQKDEKIVFKDLR